MTGLVCKRAYARSLGAIKKLSPRHLAFYMTSLQTTIRPRARNRVQHAWQRVQSRPRNGTQRGSASCREFIATSQAPQQIHRPYQGIPGNTVSSDRLMHDIKSRCVLTNCELGIVPPHRLSAVLPSSLTWNLSNVAVTILTWTPAEVPQKVARELSATIAI